MAKPGYEFWTPWVPQWAEVEVNMSSKGAEGFLRPLHTLSSSFSPHHLFSGVHHSHMFLFQPVSIWCWGLPVEAVSKTWCHCKWNSPVLPASFLPNTHLSSTVQCQLIFFITLPPLPFLSHSLFLFLYLYFYFIYLHVLLVGCLFWCSQLKQG